jgi:tRNA-modifying protein YgfZ
MDAQFTAALLPNRGVLKVDGADARGFLDGLLTANMAGAVPGRGIHAALLSPQGKIMADMFVTEADAEEGGGFYIDAPLVAVEALAKKFSLYKLRAEVTITDQTADIGVIALWGGIEPLDIGLSFLDPRTPAMGHRILAHRTQLEPIAAEMGASVVAAADYHAWRVMHGMGEVGFDFQLNDAFPHEINMDQLGGVDFRKGCYVGQEVVSRMEHRGTARTRLVTLAYADGVTVMEGAQVTAGDKSLGVTGTGANGRGLAMLRLDRVADAMMGGAAILAGGVEASLVKPAWWTANWPGEAAPAG